MQGFFPAEKAKWDLPSVRRPGGSLCRRDGGGERIARNVVSGMMEVVFISEEENLVG